jgi:hypothetical protein
VSTAATVQAASTMEPSAIPSFTADVTVERIKTLTCKIKVRRRIALKLSAASS